MTPAKYTPQATRRALVESAAAKIHRHGFQATSLETILAETGVTKGALYHHFPNKQALGLAVIEEVYRDALVGEWSAALDHASDPVEALLGLLERKHGSTCPASVEFGCPINNLAQELASVDEAFRVQIEAVLDAWRDVIARALERGRAGGQVRAEVDPRGIAVFITSLIEGATGAAKNARDPGLLCSALATLAAFVRTLRPHAS